MKKIVITLIVATLNLTATDPRQVLLTAALALGQQNEASTTPNQKQEFDHAPTKHTEKKPKPVRIKTKNRVQQPRK